MTFAIWPDPPVLRNPLKRHVVNCQSVYCRGSWQPRDASHQSTVSTSGMCITGSSLHNRYGLDADSPIRGITRMELTRTESVARGDTLTPYDFAMDEVTGASSRLVRALLVRTLKRADATTTEQEYSNARSVYERMIDLYPRMRLDATQRASLLKELGLLSSRLEECEADERKAPSTRR